MNVTTKESGKLNAVLTVNITPEDYQEKVDKVLKDYRKRANIPGFRSGKVPAGLVKKQYGKAVLIDEINHLLQHAVHDHIQKEKLDILGNPLPVPNESIDFDHEKEFSFDFEIGLAPEFELKPLDKFKVNYYKIKADKKMVDRYVADYSKRFGKMSQPEEIAAETIVKAHFTEVDKKGNPVEDGLSGEGTFSMESVDDSKSAKALKGMKVGEKTVLDFKKAFKKEFNSAKLLETTTANLESSTMKFEAEILELTDIEPHPLNQEFFDKIFGEGAVKSEEEFRQKLGEDSEKAFVGDSDRKFLEDLKDAVLAKTKFELPDEFLKKWMARDSENDLTEEEIEEDYPKMRETLKWQLVENKVAKENDIATSREELMAYAKQLVAGQMAQYGQQPQEAELEDIAKRILENPDEGRRIAEQLFSAKLLKFYKETVKMNEKEVSFDEFLKLVK